jgi:hypothetical protein
MKSIFFIITCLCISTLLSAQQVANETPYVNTDYRKYLYLHLDNPVYISTGKYKSVKIELSNGNGTITKAKEPGKYFIKPVSVGPAVVTLTAPGYKKQFEFDCITLPYPEIYLAGSANEDNMLHVKWSKGIYVRHHTIDHSIFFTVDSFKVTINDSSGQTSFMNAGAAWSNDVQHAIWKAKENFELTLDKVYITWLDKQKLVLGPRKFYMWTARTR